MGRGWEFWDALGRGQGTQRLGKVTRDAVEGAWVEVKAECVEMKLGKCLVSPEPSSRLCWQGNLAQDASPFSWSPDFSGTSAAQTRVKPLYFTSNKSCFFLNLLKSQGWFPPPKVR